MVSLKPLSRFWSSTSGSVIILYALMLPILVGFTGLGVEVGYWYVSKRGLQTAADAGAIAATHERSAGNDESTIHDGALVEAVRNGFKDLTGNLITVNNPPLAGDYAGNMSAVEVILDQLHQKLFSRVLYDGDVNIETRAVALQTPGGTACILGLNETQNDTVTAAGSNILLMPGCVIASNSNASDAISIQGATTVQADSLWTVGNYQIEGNSANLDLENLSVTRSYALDDPFEDTPIPPLGSCDETNTVWNNGNSANRTVDPGVDDLMYFCNGLTIEGGNIDFRPGTYVIDRGDMEIKGSATVRCSLCSPGGEGVTFILTASNPAQIGTLYIAGSAHVELNAPSTGDYAGILFYQDGRATIAGTSTVRGDSSSSVVGAFYFPGTHIEFAGNTSGTSECVLIVGDTVTVTGSAVLNTTRCEEYGFETVRTIKIVLVE
jgi:hypothetical protein